MKRANELAKELGVTNKEFVLFLKDSFPELGITDPARHHGKSVPTLYLDDVVAKFKAAHGAGETSSDDASAEPAAEPEAAPASEPVKPVEAAKPEPEVETAKPAPAPAPAPAPVVAKPAPAIIMPAPKPAPVSVPPSVPPVAAKPAPVAPPPLPRPAPAPVVSAPPPAARPAPSPAPVAVPPVNRPPVVSAPAPVNAPRPAPAAPPAIARPAGAAPGVPPVVARPAGAAPSMPPPFARPATAGAAPNVPPMAARTAPTAVPAGVKPALGSTPKLAPADVKGTLNVRPPIVVRDFAIALQVKPFKLLSDLMEAGIFASLNTAIDEPVAVRVAHKYGFALEVKHRGEAGQPLPKKVEAPAPAEDDPKLLEPRPPVVCVLGHVDHGKTTLLDYYRKTNVVSGEAGGITQRVGAYTVKYSGDKAEHKGKLITFIDTPGHAAFAKMRERGAAVTDIAVLVVAADDGFMPQTEEALRFAQQNEVALVVAINKADAKGANIDRVKQQMQKMNIAPEDWGGTVLTNPVSALKGTGMDELLESILLQAEMMELKANPKCPAQGVVVESQMETGRGPTATVIVKKGTLKPGDAFVCGAVSCRVRALMDDRGNKLDKIGPGMTALIMGWSGTPSPGAVFTVVKNPREAERQAEENALELRRALDEENDQAKKAAVAEAQKMSDLDRLMSLVNAQTKEKVLKVVLKADVNGTLEALQACLEAIKSTKVRLEVVTGSVGPITPSDVNSAAAAGAVIVAFSTKADPSATPLLKRHNIKVVTHEIIYFLIDLVKDEMAGLLDPELKENKLGAAEVRAIFPFGKNGAIAGCMVTEGSIKRSARARLVRKGKVLHDSEVDTLKRIKEDVTEVKAGYECGATLEGFNAYQIGDVIEAYEIVKVRAAL